MVFLEAMNKRSRIQTISDEIITELLGDSKNDMAMLAGESHGRDGNGTLFS